MTDNLSKYEGHTPGLSCGHVSTINSKGRCHALPFLALGILVGCFLSSLLDVAALKLARWWLRRP